LSKHSPIDDELLINYLLDEVDPITRNVVEQWLHESKENLDYYNQFKRVWEESKLLMPENIPDTEDAWQRLSTKMKTNAQPKLRITWRRMMSAAAAVLLFFLGLYFLWPNSPKSPSNIARVEQVDTTLEYKKISSTTESLVDTLSDQSIVTLNHSASLSVPTQFASHERRVQLKGEAFFSITPDKTKPFFIETQNQVEIKVLGTSFNVKSYADFTEVVVETGTVQLRKFDKLIVLHANEMVRIDNMDSTMQVKKSRDKLYKYYRSREFECDNTPLWKVVEVLNEAYEDSIIIENKELKKMPLTARFSNESLESVLNVLSETFEIKVEKKGNNYILK
jgi:transmembrane sensor